MPRKKSGKKSIDPAQILHLLEENPCSPRRLLREMVLPPGRRAELVNILMKLIEEGKIIRMRGGLFGIPKSVKIIKGRFVQTQPGFAFVIPAHESEPDLYIPGSGIKDAMPNDEVEVRVVSQIRRRKERAFRRQAQIIRILKRANEQIVGCYVQTQGRGLIQPDGMSGLHEFIVPGNKNKGAKNGEKVVAKVTIWPNRDWPGQAEIIEVIGPAADPGVGITAIVRRYQLPENFSPAALAQARQVARLPDPSVYTQRLDLRERMVVTIDGADARDFDDAVSCEENSEGGWHLGVHIADVSYYVKTGTRLDLEARERGTSVYLPDRVLHMLPEPLSCGVCSLVPDQDRLAVSVFMDVEPDGKISCTTFYRSVIRSQARLTYDWVEEVLTKPATNNPATPFSQTLKQLHAVAKALRARREARGSLDFDLPDPRVVLGADGQVQTIEKREQLASHRLIEDCMIAANEAVAEYLRRKDVPSLYRVHEAPAGEKLEEFQEFLEAYGYSLKIGRPRQAAKVFQRLVKSWQGKPEADILNMALLRAMKLAVYAPKNIGHFGLGSACYTHFTSPIRRYPDLIVHRMLTEQLEKKVLAGERRNTLQAQMATWAEQLSTAERRAEKAEREAVKLMQIEFMTRKIGECFEGTITTVTNFGFFVELKDHFVEGLVRAADLRDDYYYFEEQRRFLQGVNSGRIFRIGQSVRIRVERIDPLEQRVIFTLPDELPTAKTSSRRNPPRLVRKSRRKRF